MATWNFMNAALASTLPRASRSLSLNGSRALRISRSSELPLLVKSLTMPAAVSALTLAQVCGSTPGSTAMAAARVAFTIGESAATHIIETYRASICATSAS